MSEIDLLPSPKVEDDAEQRARKSVKKVKAKEKKINVRDLLDEVDDLDLDSPGLNDLDADDDIIE